MVNNTNNYDFEKIKIIKRDMNINKENLKNYKIEEINLKLYRSKSRKDLISFLLEYNYIYFITITFKPFVNNHQRSFQTKSIIRMLNNDYFRRNRVDYFKGFAFEEMHKSGDIHYHILIENHDIFNHKVNNNKDFRKIIKDKVNRIKTMNYERGEMVYTSIKTIDFENGVVVNDYKNGNLEEYLTKSLEGLPNNFEFLKPLTRDGFV